MFSTILKDTNTPVHVESMDAALADFRRNYPAYDTTRKLDELRATEYARLDRLGHVYLDYTGGGLYAECQLREHFALLNKEVYGNPHSKNLTSTAMTQRVEQARAYVLRYFNASPDEYMVIFTQNATGALKLVGKSYPFAPGDTFLLTYDNHNSVNGIREFARARGASVSYIPLAPPTLRVETDRLMQALEMPHPGQNNLFAYPAQSNFTGVQHPLDWIALAQANGWDVLLDAASFAPSNRLDLARWHPDFVDFSFYKIFGYPTGTGCLLVRKSAAQKLRRPWYAGGTITFSSVVAFDHYLTPGPAGFEDGTVNYLSLPAVEIGLKYIESIGIDLIHTRVMCLTGWLIEQLLALRHSSGRPADPFVRAAQYLPARGDGAGQLLRSAGSDDRLHRGGAAGERGAHLAACGLPLQPRGARGIPGFHGGGPGALFPRQGDADLRAVSGRHRRQDDRGPAGIDRPGDQFRRCLQVRPVRRRFYR